MNKLFNEHFLDPAIALLTSVVPTESKTFKVRKKILRKLELCLCLDTRPTSGHGRVFDDIRCMVQCIMAIKLKVDESTEDSDIEKIAECLFLSIKHQAMQVHALNEGRTTDCDSAILEVCRQLSFEV